MPGYLAYGNGHFYSYEVSKPPQELPTLPQLLAVAKQLRRLDRYAGEVVIRKELRISPFHFGVLMNRAIEDPDAWALEPTVMRQFKNKRDASRALRERAVQGRL